LSLELEDRSDLDEEASTPFSVPMACASLSTLGGAFLFIGSISPWTQDSLVTIPVTFYRDGVQLGTNQGFSIAGAISIAVGVVAILSGSLRLAERELPRWLDSAPIAAGVVGVAVGLYGLAEATWYKHQLLVPPGRFASARPIFNATAGYGIWLVVIGGWLVLFSGIFSMPTTRTSRQQAVLATAITVTVAAAAVLLAPEWV
jgi:hypothetical protein